MHFQRLQYEGDTSSFTEHAGSGIRVLFREQPYTYGVMVGVEQTQGHKALAWAYLDPSGIIADFRRYFDDINEAEQALTEFLLANGHTIESGC